MIKKITFLFVLVLGLGTATAQNPTQFSDNALNDTFVTTNGKEVSLSEILEQHRGKTILIDVWASWCRDCLGGLPKVKKIQSKHTDVVYVFLSLDKTMAAWKKAIKKHDIQGQHYYMQSGWKGDFGAFLNLDWIPRYLVVDTKGNIALYKATKASDKNIIKHL